MLVVKINEEKYEYDIHSLVNAFFTEDMVKVLTPMVAEEKRKEWEEHIGLVMHITEQEATISVVENPTNVLLKNHAGRVFRWEVTSTDTKAHCEDNKKSFKKFLYRTLVTLTGKKLPWGNLTGIRPTKIAMGLLEEGKSEEEILSFMKEEHYVSDEKAALSFEIAKREQELLAPIHYENGYSLYIGIPFCPTTCLYCSFTSNPICKWKNKVDAYIDCLIREMDYVKEEFADKVLDTVYIGGGTPTTLNAEQLDRLLTALKGHFDFNTVKEFTVEAGRADSITEDKLLVIKEHQVDRISINPQTMKGETLKLIGRQHTVEQVKEAYALARKISGFNINMDIILGLPGEDEADVAETIRQICEMEPDSLTVHSLAIKRASGLAQWIEKNGVEALKNTDTTMEIAARGAASMDMHPYYLYRQKNMSGNFENVGYAKEGNYGLYNILIMEEKQTIVALGAGSITKAVYPDGRIERAENIKDIALYMEKIDEMIERKRRLFKEWS